MAKIKKQKSGNYVVDVYDVYGVRHRPHFPLLKYAKAYVARIEQDKSNHRLFKAGLIMKPTSFAEAISEFKEIKKELRKKSYTKYVNILTQFNGFINDLGLTNIDEFTREHADLFRKNLVDSGAASKTINQYLQTVKALFRDQISRDRLTINPTSHLKNLPKKIETIAEREAKLFSEDEITRFFSQDMPEYLQTIFLGLFLTGCRIGELASLTWNGSVDFERRLIMIRTTENFTCKTRSSERNIPMTDGLFDLLMKNRESSQSDFVFPSENGKQLTEKLALVQCKRISGKAKIERNTHPHMWRHTFISFLVRTGMDYSERQSIFGHGPINVTDHYTKIDATKLHGKITKLDKYVFPTINNKAISK